MPKFLMNSIRTYRLATIIALSVGALFIVFIKPWAGLIFAGIIAALLFAMYRTDMRVEKALHQYVDSLSSRMQHVEEDVIHHLPVGIIVYDKEGRIQWHNDIVSRWIHVVGHADSPETTDTSEEEAVASLIGYSLSQLFSEWPEWEKEARQEGLMRVDQRVLGVRHHPAQRLLYIWDETQQAQIRQKYMQQRIAFMHVHLDNLEEVTQDISDEARTILLNDVSSTLTRWANEIGMYMKRTNVDMFFGILNEQILHQLEENRFEILNTVRERTADQKIPITLSIGVGAGDNEYIQLAQYAQSGLDMALGRGGDQAAVKRGQNKTVFYGGRTNAVEKRTKVRARVIAHALRDTIRESDRVLVMGHTDPDMDALGAAIGIAKAAEFHQKPATIVLDRRQCLTGVDRLLQHIDADELLSSWIASPEQAAEQATDRTLLVIVDVHRPSHVVAPQLLERLEKKIVIDHHRRGEEFIADPLLVYIEPYASSTSELVTELLEYQRNNVRLRKLEATAMLAGIVVDTAAFAFRTGARTFEAASFLRKQGADTQLVQQLLKEDKDQFIQRSKIVANAEMITEEVAIAIAPGECFDKILLAQAADSLLTLDDVHASFVVGKLRDGQVCISARSLGEWNVQLVMERMHGGGHLTNAATQLEDISIENAVQWLRETIEDYAQGGDRA